MGGRWRRGLAVTAVVGLGLLAAAPVAAQSYLSDEDTWTVELTPYLWLLSVTGDVGVLGAPPTSIDASFSDILDNLDFAAMGTVEVRRGRWGLVLDGIYAKVSQHGDTPGPAFGRVDVRTETGILTPAVTFRLTPSQPVSFDLMAGARIWFTETELKLGAGVLQTRRFTDSQVWADPVVGARLIGWLSEKWFVSLVGDVGGFGVSSDVTWQAFGGIGYRINDTWTVRAGYRALGVDYEHDGFRFNVIEQGPLIGVGIRF